MLNYVVKISRMSAKYLPKERLNTVRVLLANSSTAVGWTDAVVGKLTASNDSYRTWCESDSLPEKNADQAAFIRHQTSAVDSVECTVRISVIHQWRISDKMQAKIAHFAYFITSDRIIWSRDPAWRVLLTCIMNITWCNYSTDCFYKPNSGRHDVLHQTFHEISLPKDTNACRHNDADIPVSMESWKNVLSAETSNLLTKRDSN